MSDGTQTIGAKYGTLERGTKYYFEDVSGTLYCVTMIAKSDGTVIADPTSIRALTASDVVTANLSATDNAVLDDIAANQTDNSQKTQIIDASGNVVTTVLDAENKRHLAVGIIQDVIADAHNSSTTNLAAGNSYTFTGTSTTTLGVVGIQVNLYADKNCEILVQQSQDGTNWDISDPFYYTAEESFGTTVQATASYLRVIVTTNAETTTEFRLQTVLCPIVEALPRSLDANGHLKVATGSDIYDWQAENTPMGEARVAELTRLVGTSFEGTSIDANFWTTAAAGTSAAIAQANAQILLTSGTSSGAAVTAYSVRRGRYSGGAGMRYRAVVQVSAGLADNTRRWGIGWGATMPTVTDGAWFMWSGTTFQLQVMKGTSATTITSFNGNLGATYDPGTNVKTYEIYWTNSKVYFVVGDEVLHIHSASAATWSNTLTFHVFMDSLNADVIGASTTLAVRTATIYRLGKLQTQPQYYYFASGQTAGVNLKLGAGNLHSMIINNVTNNAVITLSDSVSAATPAILVHTAGATSTAVVPIDMKGLPFSNGLRLTVASANASVTVIYE